MSYLGNSFLQGIISPEFGGTGLTAVGAANTILGINSTGQVYENKAIAGTTNRVTVNHTANTVTLTGPQDIHSAATPTFLGLNATGGTVSASTLLFNGTQTWNNSGVQFTALKLNVVNTASQAGSILMDLQVGGSTMMKVDRAGVLTLGTALAVGQGGTGATTLTSGGLLVGNGTSAVGIASAAQIVAAISTTAVTNATNATNVTGTTTASIPVTALGSGTADSTTFLRGDRTFQTLTVSAQIQPISASVGSNALTISASALTLAFRSTTLGSGTVTTVASTPANLVVPSTATLGTINAVQSRLAVLAMNNAGTIELAVVNIAGGNDLSETGVISTTTIAGGSNTANVIYSTTGRSNLAYRVIGYIESTQATAGTWATAPSTIQGAGGNAVTAMSSLGYGQTWQTFTSGNRVSGTTYYNTTGKPIMVKMTYANSTGGNAILTIAGVIVDTIAIASTAASRGTVTGVVQPGQSYSVSYTGFDAWLELR
jgi:hypothetical protein